MAFNFTRAAFLDEALEDLFVVIENSLVDAALLAAAPAGDRDPARRHVARLSRSAASSAAAGRSATTRSTPDSRRAIFGGPEIVLAPKAVQDTFHFGGAHPRLAAARRARRHGCRHQARAGGGARARARAGAAPAAGADARRPSASPTSCASIAPKDSPSAAVWRRGSAAGSASRRAAATASTTSWGRAAAPSRGSRREWGVRLFGQSDFRDAGDVQERSLLVNSIAAQEFAIDYTDPYGVHAVGIGFDALGTRKLPPAPRRIDRAPAPACRCAPRPPTDTFQPILPAAPLRATRISLTGDSSDRALLPRHRAPSSTASFASVTSPPTTTASPSSRRTSAARFSRRGSSGHTRRATVGALHRRRRSRCRRRAPPAGVALLRRSS